MIIKNDTGNTSEVILYYHMMNKINLCLYCSCLCMHKYFVICNLTNNFDKTYLPCNVHSVQILYKRAF